jgi:topoisomerase-4 subunit A
LLLANTGGYGLLARLSDMQSRQKGGKSFLTIDDGDKLLPPSVVGTSTQVACLSHTGRLLVFALDELKLQPNGGRGLTLMDVDAKDPLVSVAALGAALKVEGTGRGGKAKEEVLKGAGLAVYAGKRARKGKPADLAMKPTRVLPG